MFKLIGEIMSYRSGVSKKDGNPFAFLKVKSHYVNFGELQTNDYEIFCPEAWPSFEKMQYATIEVPCAVSMDFKKGVLKVAGLSGMGVEPRLLKAAPKSEEEYLEQARAHYRAGKQAEKEAENSSKDKPVELKKVSTKAS